MVSVQMSPQIRLVQNNDRLMAEKLQSTIVNTIPLWKSQMAVSYTHLKKAPRKQDMIEKYKPSNGRYWLTGIVCMLYALNGPLYRWQAVSYTHLDVYKRQAHSLEKKLCALLFDRCSFEEFAFCKLFGRSPNGVSHE